VKEGYSEEKGIDEDSRRKESNRGRSGRRRGCEDVKMRRCEDVKDEDMQVWREGSGVEFEGGE